MCSSHLGNWLNLFNSCFWEPEILCFVGRNTVENSLVHLKGFLAHLWLWGNFWHCSGLVYPLIFVCVCVWGFNYPLLAFCCAQKPSQKFVGLEWVGTLEFLGTFSNVDRQAVGVCVCVLSHTCTTDVRRHLVAETFRTSSKVWGSISALCSKLNFVNRSIRSEVMGKNVFGVFFANLRHSVFRYFPYVFCVVEALLYQHNSQTHCQWGIFCQS